MFEGQNRLLVLNANRVIDVMNPVLELYIVDSSVLLLWLVVRLRHSDHVHVEVVINDDNRSIGMVRCVGFPTLLLLYSSFASSQAPD